MRGQLRVPDNVFGGAFLTGWLLGLGRGWWQLLRTKHGLSGKRDEGRRVLAHLDVLRGCGFTVPVGETVAAEAGEDHQIDVLHIRALLVEMLQQAAKRCGLEFDGIHVLALTGHGRAIIQGSTRGARALCDGDHHYGEDESATVWTVKLEIAVSRH